MASSSAIPACHVMYQTTEQYTGTELNAKVQKVFKPSSNSFACKNSNVREVEQSSTQ